MNNLILAITSFVLSISSALSVEKHVFISPVPENYVVDYQKNSQVFEIVKPPDRNDELAQVVRKAMQGTTGDYAIVIKNLKTGVSYSQNENKLMHAASLYKSWLVTAVYEDIRDGKLLEDQKLRESIPGLNNYFVIAPEDQELSSGYIDMTVKQAVEQTITISHNYTALALLKNVGGYDRVEKVLDEFGLANSTFKIRPQTTAGDMAIFLEKLYKREIGDEQISEKLIEVMSRNKLNEGLPKYLPNKVTVAHKTGEIMTYKHDAGIVYAPAGDYLIVAMSDSLSTFGAEERIAQISRAVYDYFNTL